MDTKINYSLEISKCLVSVNRKKKPEWKYKNLIRLGVDQDHAYAWKD
ncbi:hypothetical protein [Cyclobacterium amurskyense]